MITTKENDRKIKRKKELTVNIEVVVVTLIKKLNLWLTAPRGATPVN